MINDKSYLSQLYDGEIVPLEKCVPRTKEYKDIGAKIELALSKLEENVSEGDYKLITGIIEYCNARAGEEVALSFDTGIRHGIKLMNDIFSRPEDQTTK